MNKWNKGKTKETDSRIALASAKSSETLKKTHKEGRFPKLKDHSNKVGEAVKTGKSFDFGSVSSRTITKVMQRLKAGCALCGWNESTCDIHHIFGRKIENAHSIEKLIFLCPNHHRIIHTKEQEFDWWKGKTIFDVIGQDRLNEVYYG